MNIKADIQVLHTNPYWLRFNENWIYKQLKNLPESVTNHVFCERTTNLDLFPVNHLYALSSTDYKFHSLLRKAQLKSLQLTLHRKRLLKVISNQQIDIVHSHFGHFGWNDMVKSSGRRYKQIVTFYGADVTRLPKMNPIWKDRYKELFSKVDMVLCEGSHMAQQVIKLGCDSSKVKVHHLGVNVESIEFRARQWQKEEQLNILMASSFREKKGIPFAIKALDRLATDIDLKITIIGDASPTLDSQQEKKKIVEAIKESQLTDKIHFLGNQPYDVLIRESFKNHIFVSSSITASDGDTEGGAPVSLIDMAATGMPIVSSFHCDIPEVILHGETGRLAKEKDVEDIYKQLKWYVENPNRWHTILRKARSRMENEYNARTQGQRLYEIYKSQVAS